MAYLRNEGSTGVQFKEVYQGIERDSMAYKLMSSMGWQEGEGLGAQKQGISTHVKAHKKFDTLGVGLKEQAARMQDWTLDMCKFSAVLKGLQEISAPEGESEEQQPSKPENAARSRKQKKRAREGEGADAPAEQVACPGKEASQLQTAKHAKMYSWRKQQKMVKGYSATDIAAILGHAPDVPTVPAVTPPQQAAEPQNQGATKKEKKKKRVARSEECVVAPVAQQDASPAPDRPASTPPPPPPVQIDRWWSIGFRRGESMGAGNSRVAAATRTAFSELDQSALYASAQAVKSQGHKGLGSKSAKLKASQWQGRKVSFDSDEGEEEEANKDTTDNLAGVLTGDRDQDTLPGGTIVVWGGRTPEWFSSLAMQKQQTQGRDVPPEPANEQALAGVENLSKSLSLTKKQRKKCLKVACKMLKSCEGGIKLNAVVDSALTALKVSQQTADAEKLRSKIKSVIKQGEGWSIQGGKLMTAIAVTS